MDKCSYCGGPLGLDRIESSGGGFRHYSKIDCADFLLLQNDEFRKALERISTAGVVPTYDGVKGLQEIAKAALMEKRNSESDPFIGCSACGAPKLCSCGHPVVMHRPKCFWVGLCRCQTELPPDLVAQAVATEKWILEQPHPPRAEGDLAPPGNAAGDAASVSAPAGLAPCQNCGFFHGPDCARPIRSS